MRRKGVSLLEALIVVSILAIFGGILSFVLGKQKDLWLQSDSREQAWREMTKAEARLSQDLRNSSIQQAAYLPVPAHLSGYDGDGLSFLTSDDGNAGPDWSIETNGRVRYTRQVTYHLAVSNPPGDVIVGPPDASGYEQYSPYKWLLRRVDPAGSALNTDWSNWLISPTQVAAPIPNTSVISRKLLGFRVLQGPPIWKLQLSAVAIQDARHRGRLGSMPLGQSEFALRYSFSIRAHNP